MARTSIRLRIWQLAALSCGGIAVLGALLAWSLERSREANGWVEHTQMILRELQAYNQSLTDAETGQRGYLLTREDAYLVPYQDALSASEGHLTRLKDLISDDVAQSKLKHLADVFDDKINELGETVKLTRAGNLDGALAIVREGRGRRDTEEFQRTRKEITGVETSLLVRRQEAAELQIKSVMVFVVGGGGMIILLVIVAAYRTISRIQMPLLRLMKGIAALGEGQMDKRIDVLSSDEIGKVGVAFNTMADQLLTAKQARELVEGDLARSNQQLLSEIYDRGAAQAKLSESLTELERSNKDLDSFAYVASHDLKAPLRGIRNLAEWIAEDVNDRVGEDTLQNLTFLKNRIDRLDMLLDSLLQYSRVGRQGGRPELIDTAKLVQEISDYIEPNSGFSVQVIGEMPVIRTDKASLEQVLGSLIGNGLKHHDKDAGSVVVSACDQGDWVEFRVEDDGPGIAPTYHERIFQMFQTLKPRDTLEGSGMGLAIAKKSVEIHRGAIRVESAPPTRGTTFVFTWPKDQAG